MDYDDHGHAAMPKLVGGPLYSRPPIVGVERIERPPDPDDLPLVAERTDEDHALARALGLDGSSASAGAVAVTARHTTAGVGPAPYAGGAFTVTNESSNTWTPRRGLGGLFRGRSGRSGAS